MRKLLGWSWPPVLAAGALILALSGPFWAQDKKGSMGGGGMVPKAADKVIYSVLREVANHGAELFNKQGDWAGCYRVYEGALLTVKPFLAHRPALQKAIDEGIQKAGQEPRVIERAFALRAVIDQVRAEIKGTAVVSKKIDDKKPATGVEGRLSGKVTIGGQPAGLNFVTLISAADKRSYSTPIQADGTYIFRTPIPAGKYVVILEEGQRRKGSPAPAAIPDRYRNPATSGLIVVVPSESASHDIQLQGAPKDR